jgi:hypothetical protein
MLLMYAQCYQLSLLSEYSRGVQRVRKAISGRTPSLATSVINLVSTAEK